MDIYEQPYNPRRPVVCFDERPCQLLGDVLMPIPMKPGYIERQDYHYKRYGTCVVLMAVMHEKIFTSLGQYGIFTAVNRGNYKMAKNGKTLKSKMTDTGRGALLENMNRDITRIAEVQAATADDVSKIKKVVERMPTMESAINTISTAVMQLSGDIKDLKNDVKDLKNKIDENLSNHDKRITKLEEKVLI